MERETANQLRQILAAKVSGGANVSLRAILDESHKADIVLTPALSSLLMELLRVIGRGDAVTLVPVTQMLTTQQAADILNVSRPFLIGLLEKHAIPYELVGRHRRIKAEALFAYKRQRDERRSGALAGLAQMDGELL
jgi:excisionase family DNA binding protein